MDVLGFMAWSHRYVLVQYRMLCGDVSPEK